MEVVLDTTDALASVLDALCATEPTRMADGVTIQALHRQLERLSALTTRATAAFDAGRSWDEDGARSAAAWVAVRCNLPLATARRRVHLGRALRHMPKVDVAWLRGDISEAHVGLLAAAHTPVTADCFARDEAALVEQAQELRYRHFARALAYWRQLADPDGTEKDAEAQHDDRRLHLSRSFGRSWVLDGLFDPVNGAIVAGALRRIEDELFHADWAEARARMGERASAADLARTPDQRRADALVEMARRAGARPEGARMPEPLFSVFVGYETFKGRICQMADGTVVAPGALARWLGDAWVERVVFDGPDRVKNVGVRGGCSPAPHGGRWRCATRSASTSSARSPPTTVRSTMSSPIPPAGSRSTTTGGRPAGTTTADAINEGGRHRRSGVHET